MDSSTDELNKRLNAAWAAGRHHEASAILLEEVMPRIRRWLLPRFPAISLEDAEDCFHDAVGGLMRRQPDAVNNVYSYVFTSAKNKAIEIATERQNSVYVGPDLQAKIEKGQRIFSQDGQVLGLCARLDMLSVVAEAALDEELTLREDQLRTLFALTLTKLHWRRRRLTELLLNHGPGAGNDLLAEMMGTSKEALKSLKSRTLTDLRRLLPRRPMKWESNFSMC